MARQAFVSKQGNFSGTAMSANDAIRALAQTVCKQALAGSATVTDNSGGAINPLYNVAFVPYFPNVPVSGSNLVSSATLSAAMAAVQNAVHTLITVLNAAAVKLGVETVVNNGGGTDGGGTVAAIPAVAGAAVGPAAANVNPVVVSINQAIYSAASIAKKIACATGSKELLTSLSNIVAPQHAPTDLSTLPAYTPSAGADGGANAPGVSLAAAGAAVAIWAADIATIAAAYNASVATGIPLIRPVQ